MVKKNTALMDVEVSNGMWPWLSDVGISQDAKHIIFYRNQVNHNCVSPSLANEITNNFLGNPISADLSSKVHTKDMVKDMVCLLT